MLKQYKHRYCKDVIFTMLEEKYFTVRTDMEELATYKMIRSDKPEYLYVTSSYIEKYLVPHISCFNCKHNIPETSACDFLQNKNMHMPFTYHHVHAIIEDYAHNCAKYTSREE